METNNIAKNNKKINITPPLTIYQTFRNYNYRVSTAIAEFIDNSIASFRENKNIIEANEDLGKRIEKSITIIFDNINRRLLIRDTAFGIHSKDYERALKIKALPENTFGLNEFGMGLKTAAFWFGNNLKILTVNPSEEIDQYKEGAELSLTQKDIEEGNNSISAKPFHALENNQAAFNHGTTIIISDVEKDMSNSVINSCAKSIASKYRREIHNNKIDFYIFAKDKKGAITNKFLDINCFNKNGKKDECYIDANTLNLGKKLDFEDTKILVDKNGEQVKKSFEFSVFHNDKEYFVNGEIFVRERGSRSEAGLDLFRRGRIIVEKFKDFIPEQSSFEYQRINGYLELDNFPVTQAKDNIDWEGELFNKVNRKFRNLDVVKELIKYAQEYRVKSNNKAKEAKKITKKYLEKKFNIGEENEILEKEVTKSIAEGINLEYQESDIVHKIITQEGEKNIYSRIITDNSMSNWLEINRTEYKNTLLVKLDINHAFFSPFNNFNENGKFSEEFNQTMRLFSVLWALAEEQSISLKENIDEFRKRFSELIELNKGGQDD